MEGGPGFPSPSPLSFPYKPAPGPIVLTLSPHPHCVYFPHMRIFKFKCTVRADRINLFSVFLDPPKDIVTATLLCSPRRRRSKDVKSFVIFNKHLQSSLSSFFLLKIVPKTVYSTVLIFNLCFLVFFVPSTLCLHFLF